MNMPLPIAVRMLRGAVVALLFLLGGFRLETAGAAETVATGARIGGDATRTRFVADLTQAIGFTVYVLPDPYRVMIDLPAIRFDLPPDAGRKTQGLITEFRYGEVEEGRSRIVLDTDGPVLIEKSFIAVPQWQQRAIPPRVSARWRRAATAASGDSSATGPAQDQHAGLIPIYIPKGAKKQRTPNLTPRPFETDSDDRQAQ